MCEERERLLTSVAEMIRVLPVDTLSGEEAAQWVRWFSQLERLATYGTAMCASRVAEANRTDGARQRGAVAAWLADERGESLTRGRTILATGERLRALLATRQALEEGAISVSQAAEVARGATLDPTAEQELLEAAYAGSLSRLHDEASRIVERASRPKTEEEASKRARRSRLRRYLKLWSDPEGGCRFSGRFPPEEGRLFRAALEDEARRMLSFARPRARLLDALGEIVKERGRTRRRTRSAAIVRVDVAALRRGRAEDDEVCELPGIGPISVRTAIELLGETMAYLLVTDGVDVKTLCCLGDGLPLSMEIALEERDAACAIPGCGETQYLSVLRWRRSDSASEESALADFCRLCRFHRYYVDHLGFGIAGEPGTFSLVPPEDSTPVDDRAPDPEPPDPPDPEPPDP